MIFKDIDMDKETIIQTINHHLTKSEKEFYQDYYIGITNDVDERLFSYHQVDKESDWWIHCKADTEEISREVEKCFLDKGMDGDTGGGNPNTPPLYVYCYEIGEHTKER